MSLVIILVFFWSFNIVKSGHYFRYENSEGFSECDFSPNTDDAIKLKQCARECQSSSSCILWNNHTGSLCSRSSDESQKRENTYAPLGFPVIYMVMNKGSGEFIKVALVPGKTEGTGVFKDKYLKSHIFVKARGSLIWSTRSGIQEQVKGHGQIPKMLSRDVTHFMQVHRNNIFYIPGNFGVPKKRITKLALSGGENLLEKNTFHDSKTAKTGLVIDEDKIYWIEKEKVKVLYYAELPSNKAKRLYSFDIDTVSRLSVQAVAKDITVVGLVDQESHIPHFMIYLNIGGIRKEVCYNNDSSSLDDTRTIIIDYPYFYYSPCGTNRVEARRIFMDCSVGSPIMVARFPGFPDVINKRRCVRFDLV